MRSNIKKVISYAVTLLLWLCIWEIASRIIDLNFLLPGVIPTAKRLFELLLTLSFWKTIFSSVFRILLGFIIGISAGALLAPLCKRFAIVNTFISFFMTVIKSTPVASFIMILWVMIGSAFLPSVIGVLMVMPIVWQNLMNAFDAIDGKLYEVAEIFGLSKKAKFKFLIFPTMMQYFIPAVLTSIGLAWKSGIAAEILTYTKNSIGRNILDAKNYFEGADLLAWTATVIAISLLFEFIISGLVRRYKNANHY